MGSSQDVSEVTQSLTKMSTTHHDTAGKVITCKAAVAWGAKQRLVMEDVEVDPPQKMEVRIRITHTSLCHTDATFWLHDAMPFPRIFGHEAAGIVESVGEGVEDLKAGDHVVPLFKGECGQCKYCKSSKTNMCRNFEVDGTRTSMRGDGKTRFRCRGVPVYHFLTSTFSEYTVVDYACVAKIDPSLPLEHACLLSCGIATGVGAAWNTAEVVPGSSVVIFGLGSVGLAVAEGARLRGASKIIGVDNNPEKFRKAKEFGVSQCINPKDFSKPIHEVIADMTGGGADYAFECVGNADVMYDCFLSVDERWGLAVIVGVDVSGRMLRFNPGDFLSGRKIDGSVFGGFKGRSQFGVLVDKCLNQDLRVEAFMTHRLPFSEINEAFDLLLNGKSLRCVMDLSFAMADGNSLNN